MIEPTTVIRFLAKSWLSAKVMAQASTKAVPMKVRMPPSGTSRPTTTARPA